MLCGAKPVQIGCCLTSVCCQSRCCWHWPAHDEWHGTGRSSICCGRSATGRPPKRNGRPWHSSARRGSARRPRAHAIRARRPAPRTSSRAAPSVRRALRLRRLPCRLRGTYVPRNPYSTCYASVRACVHLESVPRSAPLAVHRTHRHRVRSRALQPQPRCR